MKPVIDYEKKYKEALERAKDVHTYYCDDRDQLRKIESIFPELKESEDERIRKELIEHIKANKEADFILFKKFSPNDIIAWLEKQDKQNPTDNTKLKFHRRDTEEFINNLIAYERIH